jgi:hypothetical protein
VPEIRLDVRLLRPGALVAGVVAGRRVLVRAVSRPGGGSGWIAARDDGLPVPEVREGRCGERHVLVAAVTGGRPLSPAVGQAARGQAGALGVALAGHGIDVSRLRSSDLRVCDGVLSVWAPVAGPAAGGEGETAAFVAMVAAACPPEQAVEVRRRRRAVPVAAAAVAVLAAVVTVVPWHSETGQSAPRIAAEVAVPERPVPDAAPAAEPRPPMARVRKPAIRPRDAGPVAPKKRKRRVVKTPVAPAPARDRPVRPQRHRPVATPRDDIPVAGGDADPVPAL